MPENEKNWTDSGLGAMGSATLEQRLGEALEIFARFGVRVPHTGRHRESVKLLSRLNSGALKLSSTDTDLLRRVQAANRTAYEAFVIGYAADLRKDRRETPFTRAKLQQMMDGSFLWDGTKQRPFDFQFELFVAAMLVLGGSEVQDAEPDLLLLYGREMIGVAIKRLRSLSIDQAESNIQKGIKQIKKSERRGIVAVNLDSAFSDMPLGTKREQLFIDFGARFDVYDAVFSQYHDDDRVLGYLAFACLSEWSADSGHEGKPELVSSTAFRWFGWPNDDEEQALYQAYTTAWHARLIGSLEKLSSRGRLD